MARVNVEQKALTDGRFRTLGKLLGAKRDHARALGLGMMAFVWNQCQERGRRTLTPDEIDDAASCDGLSEAIVASDLGEREGDVIRIRGSEGRIEWLEARRSEGRGATGGGRPKKTPRGLRAVAEAETPGGLPGETPPAPALSLAPTKIKTKEDTFSDVGVSKARSPAHTGISRGQYLYLADQVGKWTKEIGGLGPWSAEEWDRKFLRRFGMTQAAFDQLQQQFSGPSSPQETSE